MFFFLFECNEMVKSEDVLAYLVDFAVVASGEGDASQQLLIFEISASLSRLDEIVKSAKPGTAAEGNPFLYRRYSPPTSII